VLRCRARRPGSQHGSAHLLGVLDDQATDEREGVGARGVVVAADAATACVEAHLVQVQVLHALAVRAIALNVAGGVREVDAQDCA